MINIPIRVNLSVNESTQQFSLVVLETTREVDLRVESRIVTNHYDLYSESYEVIPKTIKQTLKTKKKLMKDDVIVHEIPCYEVSNPSGGLTIYIANNLNG